VTFPVQPLAQNILFFRFSDLQKQQITLYPPLSRPSEGRIAIVTDAGWDAVAAGGARDERAVVADGEVVWSRCPDAGIKFAEVSA
jgi:hypothetical protein